MPLVETVLGNSNDPEWKNKLENASIDVLELSQWDAQKNRLRKETHSGLSLAISLERGTFLHNGDIILWNGETRRAVVCKIDLCDVLVIDLHALESLPPSKIIERTVRLGHALGNQHWPAVVKDHFIFVPVTVDRKVVDSVMHTHHFEGVSHTFVPGEQIVDRLEPSEARRLFGGSEIPLHGHALDGEKHGHYHNHGHCHDDSHERQHAHGHLHAPA